MSILSVRGEDAVAEAYRKLAPGAGHDDALACALDIFKSLNPDHDPATAVIETLRIISEI